jgi:hypothetical protein
MSPSPEQYIGAWRIVYTGGQGSYGVVYRVGHVQHVPPGPFALKLAIHPLSETVRLEGGRPAPGFSTIKTEAWWALRTPPPALLRTIPLLNPCKLRLAATFPTSPFLGNVGLPVAGHEPAHGTARADALREALNLQHGHSVRGARHRGANARLGGRVGGGRATQGSRTSRHCPN